MYLEGTGGCDRGQWEQTSSLWAAVRPKQDPKEAKGAALGKWASLGGLGAAGRRAQWRPVRTVSQGFLRKQLTPTPGRGFLLRGFSSFVLRLPLVLTSPEGSAFGFGLCLLQAPAPPSLTMPP